MDVFEAMAAHRCGRGVFPGPVPRAHPGLRAGKRAPQPDFARSGPEA